MSSTIKKTEADITKGWRNWNSAPTYTKEQIRKWNDELNEKARLLSSRK